MKNFLVSYFLIVSYFLTVLPVFGSTGGIVNGYHTTKVCHDTTCTTPTPGILNFRPTGATAVVIDDALGLSGDVWGNELGWITLNPTGEGVSIDDPSTGLLIGKAWSQVSGWINFEPTGQNVTIDPSSGEFSGWAWTGGPYGGWIKFDCTNADTCIKTDWRGTGAGSGSGGGSSSGSAPDVCPNIGGVQASIPQGYTIATSGDCVVFVDVCPNLFGQQTTVPQGFSISPLGACLLSVDYCSNISGTQINIPAGYVVSSTGICVKKPIDACSNEPGIQTSEQLCLEGDICSNLDGVQTQTPLGYIRSDTICFPKTFDMCSNIEGEQLFVPEGMVIDDEGVCREALFDTCSNLVGVQSVVPVGFYEKEEGICLLKVSPPEGTSSGEEIVAFSFLSPSWWIPIDDPILSSIVESLRLNTANTFRVDLLSTMLVVSAFLFLLHLGIRIILSTFR